MCVRHINKENYKVEIMPRRNPSRNAYKEPQPSYMRFQRKGVPPLFICIYNFIYLSIIFIFRSVGLRKYATRKVSLLP